MFTPQAGMLPGVQVVPKYPQAGCLLQFLLLRTLPHEYTEDVAPGFEPQKHQEIYSITILQACPRVQHQLPAFLSGPRLERGAGAAAAHPG